MSAARPGHCGVHRQHAGEDQQRRDEVDRHQIDDEFQPSGLFAEHRITPILMVQAGKRVQPVRGQADRPQQHHRRDQPAPQLVQPGLTPPIEQQHRRNHAPVRVVETRVAVRPAEHEDHQRRQQIRDQRIQHQPAGVHTPFQPRRTDRDGNDVRHPDQRQRMRLASRLHLRLPFSLTMPPVWALYRLECFGDITIECPRFLGRLAHPLLEREIGC